MENTHETFIHGSITVSTEQQKLLLEEWNNRGVDHPDGPPSLNELIKIAFPDSKNINGRTKEGRAVRAFLITKDISPRSLHNYVPKEKIELTEDQQEYVINNLRTMKGHEIARIIFVNPDLSHVSQEARTVNDFIKNLDPDVVPYNDIERTSTEEYKPPTTFSQTVNKINRYILHGINKSKITAKQKKDINALIGYMHAFRFNHQINSYDSLTAQELFESSFVRYTYDKYDLSQEEVDQYIVLSGEVVISANIQRRVERLQRLLDDTANDTEGARISMSLVEAINTAQNEYNQCVNRQHKLLGDLKQKRSDVLSKKIQNNASILNLVEAWKSEESRKKMVLLAERQKETLEKEIDSLASMDDLKCRILGIDKDEAMNG
jgi:hypothetical protein